MRMTRLIFSFRPDVRSYYKAVKMLNNIRHIFFGTIGGVGFTSPTVYCKSVVNGRWLYSATLDLALFNDIRWNRLDGDGYGLIFPIFKTCGLNPDIITLPRLVQEAVERMDNRNKKRYK